MDKELSRTLTAIWGARDFINAPWETIERILNLARLGDAIEALPHTSLIMHGCADITRDWMVGYNFNPEYGKFFKTPLDAALWVRKHAPCHESACIDANEDPCDKDKT